VHDGLQQLLRAVYTRHSVRTHLELMLPATVLRCSRRVTRIVAVCWCRVIAAAACRRGWRGRAVATGIHRHSSGGGGRGGRRHVCIRRRRRGDGRRRAIGVSVEFVRRRVRRCREVGRGAAERGTSAVSGQQCVPHATGQHSKVFALHAIGARFVGTGDQQLMVGDGTLRSVPRQRQRQRQGR
jgi:hypothetical protein